MTFCGFFDLLNAKMMKSYDFKRENISQCGPESIILQKLFGKLNVTQSLLDGLT